MLACRRTVLLAAILSVGVLVGSVVPLPLPATGPHGGGEPRTGSTPFALSEILSQPWADRAGFDPGLQSVVTDVVSTPAATMEVVLTLVPSDPTFFTATPSQPMNASAVGSAYGLTPQAYGHLESYFTAHGLEVVHEWPNRLFLSLSGSPASLGSAFGTTLLSGQHAGRLVVFPATAPSIPLELESEVASVSGLSQGFTTFTVPLSAPGSVVPAQGRTTRTVTPSAVHLLYGLSGLYNYSGSSHWASGIGIATVLWGEGYNTADLQGFFANYYPGGFPSVTIQAYPVDGAPAPSPGSVNDPSNVTSEMTLDIEWAGSAAPGSTIDAVYAPDGPAADNYSPTDATLEDAFNTASQNVPGVQVISMSFGSPDGQDLAFQAAFETAMRSATLGGQTVLAASGDNGGTASPSCSGGPTPEYPAASQWVVAVGGTAPLVGLSALGTVTGIDSEPAWNRSGGGYSVTYPGPSWQSTNGGGPPSHRGIPDVAGPAQDNIFFYKGAEAAGAGTSFAAPMWAGMIAEMDAIRGSPLGYITPRLYTVGLSEARGTAASGLTDITSGSNCVGSATVGWDDVTGWGSPRADLLYPDLVKTFVNVTVTSSQASVAPGGSFTVTALITNSSDHAPLAGLNVTITVDSPGYVGPCGGTFVGTAGLTNSTGATTATATVPGCYLGSSVAVTATVTGSFYGSGSTTVHVNLVGLAGFLAFVQVFPYNVLTFVLLVALVALIGWRIGEWNHRRRLRASRGRARAPYPATAAPSPPAPPPSGTGAAVGASSAATSVPAAPPLKEPPAAPARTSPGPPTEPEPADAAPSSEAPTLPVVVPGHVSDDAGWSSPAPLGDLPEHRGDVPGHAAGEIPAPPSPICATCGAAIPSGSANCPVCGTPTPSPTGPSS